MSREMKCPFSLSLKALVLDARGRCLLLRRSPSSKNNAGKWEFPGGKMDPGERFDETLLREVREETGLHVTLTRPFDTAMSRMPDCRVVYLFMLAEAEPDPVQLSGEHDAFLWLAPEDLPAVDLAKQYRDVAARYKAFRAS